VPPALGAVLPGPVEGFLAVVGVPDVGERVARQHVLPALAGDLLLRGVRVAHDVVHADLPGALHVLVGLVVRAGREPGLEGEAVPFVDQRAHPPFPPLAERGEDAGEPLRTELQTGQRDVAETAARPGLADHPQFPQLAEREGESLGHLVETDRREVGAVRVRRHRATPSVCSRSTAQASGTTPVTGGNSTACSVPSAASRATPQGTPASGTATSSSRCPRTVRYVHSRWASSRATA